MVNISHFLKSYKDTPAFCDFLDIVEYLDDHVFLTKSLQVGITLSVKGSDYESLLDSQLDSTATRLERALHMFDSRYRVYQYFFKMNNPIIPARDYDDPVAAAIVGSRLTTMRAQSADLFETRTFLTVLLDLPAQSKASFIQQFKAKKQISIRLAETHATCRNLVRQVESFIGAVSDYATVSICSLSDSFWLLSALFNPDPRKRNRTMPADAKRHPGYYATASTLRALPSHLELDEYKVRTLSMKGLPSTSEANALKHFFLVEGNYHIVSSYRPESQKDTAKHVADIIEHNDSTKTNALAAYFNKEQGGPVRADVSKDAQSEDLGHVKIEMTRNEKAFGLYSFTIVLYGKTDFELDVMATDFLAASQRAGIDLFTETTASTLSLLATAPGSYRYEKRAKRISEANHADFSFFFCLDTGNVRNEHLRDEYHAIFTTRNKTPYYFNAHVGELGHTLVLGPTRMGKSFLCNYLMGQSMKYKPCISIIDLGGSYKHLVEMLGGNYTNISSEDQNLRFNPFQLEKTTENIEFLTTLVTSLMEQSGDPLNDLDKNMIYNKVKELYVLEDKKHRRLSVLRKTLPPELAMRLVRWVEGGQYGYIFDNADGEDRLTTADIQAFNFEGFDPNADFLEPLLFYILKHTSSVIADDRRLDTLKIFLMDEAWTFFRNNSIRAFFINGLKATAKRNAAFFFATQAVNDLRATGLLEDMVASCPTKILLSNSSLDVQQYMQAFQMSREAAELVKSLVPKKESLLVQNADASKGSSNKLVKVMRLEVSPREKWLYSNSAKENVIRAKALAMFDGDLEKALDYLVALPPA
jgi:type IV secretion/conjugal transfer VirB4 family ATPase